MFESPILLATSAMGTRFEALIAGADEGVSPACARAAGEEAMALVRDWHARLSLFDRASVVSRLNREAADRPVRADDEVRRLLRRCLGLSRETGGLFDITAGALMHRWGFREGAPAGDASWGSELIEIDDDAGTVRYLRPGVEIDLGGVAKGAVLDEAARLLSEHGLTSALLHGGTSTIVAIGAPPCEQSWRVRVGDGPGAPIVDLCDTAMSVSAPTGRTLGVGEVSRIGHIMDPRDGRPATKALTAACVGPCALDTDAWSTALAIAGEHPAGCPDNLTTIIGGGDCWTVRAAQERRVAAPSIKESPA